MKEIKRPNRNLLLWVIIIGLHIIAFGYQFLHRNLYLTDSRGYLQEAENIRQHFIFYCNPLNGPLDIRAFTMRPPVYPLFVAAVKTIFNSDLAVIVLQNFLSLFVFSRLFKFIQKFSLSGKTRYLLPLLLLFYPAQVIYANLIMAEIFLQAFIFLFFLQVYAYLETRDLKHVWYAALWLSLGIFTKPTLLFFSAIFLFGAAYFAFSEKRWRIIIPAFLPIIMILLYNFWNLQRTGYFHFSSIKEINLLYYNSALLLENQHGVAYADSTVNAIAAKADTQPGFAAQEEYINKACGDLLIKNLAPYLKFHAKGMVNFFLDPGRFDLYNFIGQEKQNGNGLLAVFSHEGYKGVLQYLRNQPLLLMGYLLLIFIVNIIRTGLLFIFLLNKNRPVALRILAGTLIFYLAFITGPLGASRFLVPVFPLLLLACILSFKPEEFSPERH